MAQRTTLETNPAVTVLVVGGPQELLTMTQRAARSVPIAEVVFAELRDAPTRAAEKWPFTIVVSEDLYAFDATEFDALARDVSAQVLIVKFRDEIAEPSEAELSRRILEAFRRRVS